MIDRRLWLLLGAAWLALPAGAGAQPAGRPSHRTLGLNLPDASALENSLERRLRDSIEKGRLQEIQSLLQDPDRLKELTKGKLSESQLRFLQNNQEQIGKLLQNPRFRALLDKYVAAQKDPMGKSLTEGDIGALGKLADNKLDPDTLPAPEPGESTDAAGPAGAGGGKGPQEQAVENEPEGGPASAPSTPVSEGEKSWWDRQLDRFVEFAVEEMNDPEKAGSFQDALRSIGGLQRGGDGSERFDFGGLWNRASEDIAAWGMSRWEWPWTLSDRAGSFVRDVRSTVPDLGGTVDGAMSRIPAGGPPSSGVTAQAVAWVVAAVALAVLGWKYFNKAATAPARAGEAAALGPWPVEPGSVASWGDLVREFEYLAVLRLGIAARTFNHLDAADRLGGAREGDARRAAGELAKLYERARYEPDPAPPGEADLAAARRDLTLLAGASAA